MQLYPCDSVRNDTEKCSGVMSLKFATLEALKETSVDEQGLAGDEGGAFGGEPDDGVGDFVCFTDSLEGGVGSEADGVLLLRDSIVCGTFGDELAQAGGSGVAGGYVVDGDAILAKLVREALEQPEDASTH